MNQMLQKQIDAIRYQIMFNEKNYNEERDQLMEVKNSEIREKETEIDDLKESITHRDDNINDLKRSAAQKDKAISDKCLEIDNLKKMIDQIKNKARKIRRQVDRAQKQREQGKLEDDPLFHKNKEEIGILTEEMDQLQKRLATLEVELAKAFQIIKQQNDKLKIVNSEKLDLQSKLKEDLGNVSKSMRHEVERMRAVMLQNNEEMKILREQNQEIREDIRDIKKILEEYRPMGNNSPEQPSQSVSTEQLHLQQEHAQANGNGQMKANGSKLNLGNRRNSINTESRFPPLQVRNSNQFVTTNSRSDNLRVAHSDNLRVGHSNNLRVGHSDNLRVGHSDNLRLAHSDNLRVAHSDNLRVGHSDNLRFGHSDNLQVNSISTSSSNDNDKKKITNSTQRARFDTVSNYYPTVQTINTDNRGVSVQTLQAPYNHNLTNRTVIPSVHQPAQDVQSRLRRSSSIVNKSVLKKTASFRK